MTLFCSVFHYNVDGETESIPAGPCLCEVCMSSCLPGFSLHPQVNCGVYSVPVGVGVCEWPCDGWKGVLSTGLSILCPELPGKALAPGDPELE